MPPRALGLHLLPDSRLVGSGRPSCLAEVDAAGHLVRLELLEGDAQIVAALPGDPLLLVVDAPLVVPNETGRRDVEVVLSWLDCPVFPASRRRLAQLAGGVRGEALAARAAGPGRDLAEGVPDVALRQLARERAGAADQGDLGRYRAEWLALRAPRYRPKGTGRAQAAGMAEAARLLATAVDLDGWWPDPSGDDWALIADAARIDAVACALTAARALADPERVLWLGSSARGRVVVPADAAMRARAEVNLTRLRAEGAIRI
ncbi:MAG TPA: hypothetical protein VNT51_08390 [Miltoncostaeaceae bacterium]|nr:hypothetical protein [Miltoncostaeaceae bacterium]